MTDLSNLKILMLAPCLGKFGGIETFCLTLIEDLIYKGASVRLLRKKVAGFEHDRSIQKNENSGRPRKPKVSIAGGLIEIDLSENKKDKDGNVSIRVMGKSFVDIQTEPAESNSKSKDVSIRVLGKKVVDINTDDWIQVDREDKSSENS